MLFNSHVFILLFLPAVAIVYYTLARISRNGGAAANWWLVAASLFFYGYWDFRYLAVIFVSIGINYLVGLILAKPSKAALALGIVFNLGLLGYYKYSSFITQVIVNLTGLEATIHKIVLPLAISFFTFQQIAYLVDLHKGLKVDRSFRNYVLFVTFFPQLIAGPIVHHREMMPQFSSTGKRELNWSRISEGILLFCIGLFKKVIIADSLSPWVSAGFANVDHLGLIDSWVLSLSYCFQLYYDFSGYSDMAVGAALILGIRLPWNFNSPYKALSIQDFWRRWHMTLSRFLRDYVYIPLGGNRVSESRVTLNLFLSFLLGGIWHGAGWNFVIWGGLHGVACVVHRFWSLRFKVMMKPLAWVITFVFVNVAWVFFRAENIEIAMKVISAMFGFEGVSLPTKAILRFGFLDHFGHAEPFCMAGIRDKFWSMVWLFVILLGSLTLPNTIELAGRFKSQARYAFLAAFCFILAFIHLDRLSEFLYFQF